jgi:hypothetical protein
LQRNLPRPGRKQSNLLLIPQREYARREEIVLRQNKVQIRADDVDRHILDFHEYIADDREMQWLIRNSFDGFHEDMATEVVQHQLDLVRLAEPRLRDAVHDDMVQGCEHEQRRIDRTCGKLQCTTPWGTRACATFSSGPE